MSTSAWSTRSPERRGQLLNAAIAVIANEGLEAATTRRVSAHAGVSLGSVHYVFANKSEMIAAVIDYVGEAIEAALRPSVRSAIYDSGDDPVAILSAVIDRFWAFVEADRGFQIMQYELTLYCLRRPADRWLAARQYDRYRGIVVEALTEALDPGVISPELLDDLARQVVAGLDGVILQFLIHEDVERARRDVRVLRDSLQSLVEERWSGTP